MSGESKAGKTAQSRYGTEDNASGGAALQQIFIFTRTGMVPVHDQDATVDTHAQQ